jgi:hypothetical protein
VRMRIKWVHLSVRKAFLQANGVVFAAGTFLLMA